MGLRMTRTMNTAIPEETSTAVATDGLDEPVERVVVGLFRPTNAVVRGFAAHTYTIQDTDPPPTVGFATATDSAGEAAGTVWRTVHLSARSGEPMSIPTRDAETMVRRV